MVLTVNTMIVSIMVLASLDCYPHCMVLASLVLALFIIASIFAWGYHPCSHSVANSKSLLQLHWFRWRQREDTESARRWRWEDKERTRRGPGEDEERAERTRRGQGEDNVLDFAGDFWFEPCLCVISFPNYMLCFLWRAWFRRWFLSRNMLTCYEFC